MKDFPAAFAAVLIKVISGSGAVTIQTWAGPVAAGSDLRPPNHQELEFALGPFSPARCDNMASAT